MNMEAITQEDFEIITNAKNFSDALRASIAFVPRKQIEKLSANAHLTNREIIMLADRYILLSVDEAKNLLNNYVSKNKKLMNKYSSRLNRWITSECDRCNELMKEGYLPSGSLFIMKELPTDYFKSDHPLEDVPSDIYFNASEETYFGAYPVNFEQIYDIVSPSDTI